MKDLQFARYNQQMYDKAGRLQIASQIIKVLTKHIGAKKLKTMRVLDLGCSTGIMTGYFAKYVKSIVGIDVDVEAIAYARQNFGNRLVKFFQQDAAGTDFAQGSFDLVICNQVYCCIEEPKGLMEEIYRLLRSGGVCFLGARNKYIFWENQYQLPLLALLPKRLANFYKKFSSRPPVFDTSYKSYWELSKLCQRFVIYRYTPRILNRPHEFRFNKLKAIGWLGRLFPLQFWQKIEPIVPNFIWILEKTA